MVPSYLPSAGTDSGTVPKPRRMAAAALPFRLILAFNRLSANSFTVVFIRCEHSYRDYECVKHY